MTTGLTDADRRELAALQRRAYGPHADLDGEGAARLRELEDRLAPDDPVEPDAAPSPIDVPAPSPPTQGENTDATGPATDRLTIAQPAATQWARRHPIVVGLLAIAAAAALVGTGFALAQLSSEPVAGVLEPVPLDPEGARVVAGTASFQIRDLDPDSLEQYASLGQGTAWSASDADGGRCLILTVTDDSPEVIANAGVWDVECAPAGLPPILDWEVDENFPSPPQDLPRGSVVRFTLESDSVRLTIGVAG